jgi:hypothetical protein
MKIGLVLSAILLAVSSLAFADDGDALRHDDKFKITTMRKDDAVEVQADKDKTVFDVKSPFGFGQAVIERLDDEWPKAVVLRLHLKGLESFRATNGKETVDDRHQFTLRLLRHIGPGSLPFR